VIRKIFTDEMQGLELDEYKKATALFSVNRAVVCLLQCLLLMMVEL
jgi:hypothetical protein